MKKIAYILLFSALSLGFHSCVNEEDDLFDKSAAQRLNEAVAKYTDLLESSADGWVMDFYPSDGAMGGYTHTVLFHDGTSTLTSEVTFSNSSTGEVWEAGTPVKSLYQVKAEQECILTFDTYNLLFHFWSEPKGSSSPTGYESDYEFAFKEVSDDVILLKGKMYGNILRLTRLTEPADVYMGKVLDMSNRMAASPRLRIEVAGQTYACRLGGKNFVSETLVEGGVEVPYVFTEKGIRLYEPVTVGDITFQEFTLADDMSLRAVDADAVFPAPTMLEVFASGATTWQFDFDFAADTSSMCPELWELFKEGAEANLAEQNEDFVGMFLGANPAYPSQDSNPICFYWNSSWLGWLEYTVIYDIDMNVVEGTEDQIAITLLGGGLNYDWYTTYCDPMMEFVADHSPYRLSIDTTANVARLVSAADADAWFEVSLVQ